MAAIQQWWLGNNYYRSNIDGGGGPDPEPGEPGFLISWRLTGYNPAIQATLAGGAVVNDASQFVMSEEGASYGGYQGIAPGTVTYTSTNTTAEPDRIVLTNDPGETISMRFDFKPSTAPTPGDSFRLLCNDGLLELRMVESAGGYALSFRQPGVTISGPVLDAPYFDEYYGYDTITVFLTIDADNGTLIWQIGFDGDPEPDAGPYTLVPIERVELDSVKVVTNTGFVYQAQINGQPGPGYTAIDWTASNAGVISSNADPTGTTDWGTSPESVFFSGHYQVYHADSDLDYTAYGQITHDIPYIARMGFPDGCAEIEAYVDFRSDAHSRGALNVLDHERTGWGLSWDIADLDEITHRLIYVNRLNGGGIIGVLDYVRVQTNGTIKITARITDTGATLFINDVEVATGTHSVIGGVNALGSITLIEMNNAASFRLDPEEAGIYPPEKSLVAEYNVRSVVP